MTDLVLAACILAVVSAGIFFGVAWLARRLPRRACDGLAVVVVVLLGYYIRDVWDHIELARWMPISSLIILANWFPLAIAALAGIAWNRVPPPTARKVAAVALLFGSATYTVYHPFQGSVPECNDIWEDGVCLQTTPATCSAACAATLLRHFGIAATEQEMAELCVTRSGTTWWGLYRGLKLKTAGTEWDVEVVSGPAADLRKFLPGGVIIFVRLTADVADRNSRYEKDGWIAGTSHSVVLFELLNDIQYLVGDPSLGLEVWPMTDLEVLYQERGMRLVRRGGGGIEDGG